MRDAKIAELEAQLAELEKKGISLERRASRHAEHLGRIESKLQGLERK